MKELQLRSPEEKRAYLQAKFDYYRSYNKWFLIASCLASITYFISDCQLFGRFAWETLLSRTFILIPLAIYLILNHIIDDYRVLTILTHLCLHFIMWDTIWAIYFLPIKVHASEGFIIMQLLFLAGSFASPYFLATISHFLLLFDILISNLFNHYENLDIMLSLAIPCILAISIANLVMSNTFFDNWLNRKKLEESLILDPLTNTYNRNILPKITSDGKLTFDRTGNVSVLMIDIDFFKLVNDKYGHEKGDVVLKSIANSLQASVRGNDYVIRWGGEEFLIFMPGCIKAEAVVVAERIRTSVMNTNNTICPITVSIGVADYDRADYNLAINHADKALYVAKQTGRNKVVCYSKGETTNVLSSNGLDL